MIMAIDVIMPALSPTMEVGTLAKWHVKLGQTVKSGDILSKPYGCCSSKILSKKVLVCKIIFLSCLL